MGLWHKFTRTPGGRLEAAGVRRGDIPIETHGGLWAFYGLRIAAGVGAHRPSLRPPRCLHRGHGGKVTPINMGTHLPEIVAQIAGPEALAPAAAAPYIRSMSTISLEVFADYV
jgi:hypothetical protein